MVVVHYYGEDAEGEAGVGVEFGDVEAGTAVAVQEEDLMGGVGEGGAEGVLWVGSC